MLKWLGTEEPPLERELLKDLPGPEFAIKNKQLQIEDLSAEMGRLEELELEIDTVRSLSHFNWS